MKALIASVRFRPSRPVKMSRRSAGSPAARLAARRRILRSPPSLNNAGRVAGLGCPPRRVRAQTVKTDWS